MVSPPPMTEKAAELATARAVPRVPAEKGAFSKTPSGPFHTMVRAEARVAANWATVTGPMSSPMRSRGISRTLEKRAPHTVPEGDEKGIGHAAADEDGVDAREQMLDEAELVGDLGAAQHGHE